MKYSYIYYFLYYIKKTFIHTFMTLVVLHTQGSRLQPVCCPNYVAQFGSTRGKKFALVDVLQIVPVSECAECWRIFTPRVKRCNVLPTLRFVQWLAASPHCERFVFTQPSELSAASPAVMDYIFSVTGSGVRVVRDAISHRLWPGPGQDPVQIQQHRAGTTHDSVTIQSRPG